jgi:hypothetical protein
VPKYGAGIALRAFFDAPESLCAIISRKTQPGDPLLERFAAHKRVKGPDGKEQYLNSRDLPASRPSGKLRLSRKGDEMQFLAAEGDELFRIVQILKIGEADVKQVQVDFVTMWTPIALDARLTELTIEADQVGDGAPGALAGAVEASREPGARAWLLALGVVAMAVLSVGGVGIWLLRKHGRHTARPLADGGAEQRTDKASSPTVSFACAACHKKLCANAAFGGKQVKCPKCGQPVVVPAVTPSEAAAALRAPAVRARIRTLVTVAIVCVLGLLARLGAGALVWSRSPRETNRAATITEGNAFWSLRGDARERPPVELMGPDADVCVRFEPDGLRIKLPEGYAKVRPETGVRIPLTLKGDFDVKVSFEVLQEPSPADTGFGTRVTLGVHTRDNMAATASRMIHADGRSKYAAWSSKHSNDPAELKRVQYFPTRAKAGQLRLVRAGAVISYSVLNDAEQEFVLLQQHPFGTDDIRELQIVATTGGAKAKLDVRITDLRIEAAVLSN